MAGNVEPTGLSSPTTTSTLSTITAAVPYSNHPLRRERFQTLVVNLQTTSSIEKQDDSGDFEVKAAAATTAATTIVTTPTVTSWELATRFSLDTLCDLSLISCSTGSCYTGLNGYVGCCTAPRCLARTTCIPYHESQRVCDEITDGCVFCSDPKKPACYTFTNWYQEQFAFWCTAETTSTYHIGYYVNSNDVHGIYQPVPATNFTPSWPDSSSTSSQPRTFIVSGGMILTLGSLSSSMSSSSYPGSTGLANITSSYNSESSTTSLSTSSIIGIAIGSSVAFIALLAFFAWLIRSRRRDRSLQETSHLPHLQQSERHLPPGTWLNNGDEDARASDGLLAGGNIPREPSEELLGMEKSIRGRELADTGIAPYSRELESPYLGLNTPASSSFPNGSGVAPDTYRSTDMLSPALPYSNHQATRSDPEVLPRKELRVLGIVPTRAGAQALVSTQSSNSTEDFSTTPTVSTSPQTIRRVLGTVRRASQSHSSALQSGSIVPPTSSASLSKQNPTNHGPPIQRNKWFPSRTPSQSSADIPGVSLSPPSPTRNYSPPTSTLSTIQQSGPIHHLTQNSSTGLAPPALITAVSNVGTANRHNSSTALERLMIDCTGSEPQMVGQKSEPVNSAPSDRLSARGDWKGWVSPENALSGGLWQSELDGAVLDRKDRDDDSGSGDHPNGDAETSSKKRKLT